jgi:hypothetical protein
MKTYCPLIIGPLVFLALFFFGPTPIKAQVTINEFVPHSTPEWVEFYNASSSADYIKSYYLDDDEDFINDGGSKIKLLTDIVITNPTYPYIEINSFLNNDGDWVVLFDTNGNIVDKYKFDKEQGQGDSIGRSPDSSGSFSILISATKSGPNSAILTPSPAPVLTPTSSPTSPHTKTASPRPTNSPIQQPTPIKTISPTTVATTKPTVSSTETNKPEPTSSLEGEILGIQDTPTPVPIATTPEPKNSKNTKIALSLVALGLGIMGTAIYMGFKTSRTVEP